MEEKIKVYKLLVVRAEGKRPIRKNEDVRAWIVLKWISER
jgi:hypothetical protein